jgi:hypothetical protein
MHFQCLFHSLRCWRGSTRDEELVPHLPIPVSTRVFVQTRPFTPTTAVFVSLSHHLTLFLLLAAQTFGTCLRSTQRMCSLHQHFPPLMLSLSILPTTHTSCCASICITSSVLYSVFDYSLPYASHISSGIFLTSLSSAVNLL